MRAKKANSPKNFPKTISTIETGAENKNGRVCCRLSSLISLIDIRGTANNIRKKAAP